MSKIFGSILETIGGTPLVEVKGFDEGGARVLAKVEYFNPGGSVKDRIALSMIDDAEKRGLLLPGGTIIEPTSGNTGVGLALVSAARGYHLVLTMPDTMSIERRKLAAAYGAEVVLTPGVNGMKGAIAKAEELHETTPNSIILQQFENPANPDAHYRSTGPEIWEGTDGQVDAFVAGVGTGGTLSGVSKFLKEKKPSVKVFAIEPDTSPVLSPTRYRASARDSSPGLSIPLPMTRSSPSPPTTPAQPPAMPPGRRGSSSESPPERHCTRHSSSRRSRSSRARQS